MSTLLSWLLDTSSLEPHGFCLLWRPDLLWSTVVADGVVAASYFSIPVALVYFATQRKDLAFPWVFFLFGAFILLCGGTHVMEAVTFWVPLYAMETALKVATAIASIGTAVALWPLMPRALALPSADELRGLNLRLAGEVQDRRRAEGELRGLNLRLADEVQDRRRAEGALRDANLELEQRVAQRTAALTKLTDELQAQIAERQRVEDGMRESTELLQATFEAAPFAIAVLVEDSTVLMWNKAAERDFSYTAEEMVGRRYREVLREAEAREFDAQFRRALSGEPFRAFDVRRHHRSGRLLDIRYSCAPVRRADGRIRAIVYVLEDVTQRNAVEAQLRQAQKMEAIGNLTGGMAHDFNNLLGIIIGNLDSLQHHVALDPDNGQLVADAFEAALHGADLTRRLLAFARRQPLRPERVNVNPLVERAMALLRRTLGENIEFDIDLGRDLWPVTVDPAQLEAAITNLATNARDAMPRGGKLIIRTRTAHLDAHYVEQHPEVKAGDYASIEVCDTGTGIAPEVFSRIFEPFFTTKEEGKGSGLGLAMVFGFMKQSGGHINVYSEPGKGACFRLYLPRAAQADEHAEAPKPSEVPETGTEAVLVVEDNPRLRRIVVRQIRDLGYRVLEAENAVEALKALRDGAKIDLLFTDVVMPGEMNGPELAHAAADLIPGIKVLFTSGFPEARADAGGWIDGTVQLLTKPYRKEELARTLRHALAG